MTPTDVLPASKLQKVLRMLSSVDAFAQHENRSKERFQHTGTWLVEHLKFQKRRKEPETNTLWVHGIRKWISHVFES